MEWRWILYKRISHRKDKVTLLLLYIHFDSYLWCTFALIWFGSFLKSFLLKKLNWSWARLSYFVQLSWENILELWAAAYLQQWEERIWPGKLVSPFLCPTQPCGIFAAQKQNDWWLGSGLVAEAQNIHGPLSCSLIHQQIVRGRFTCLKL